jgi:hypothetical protein
VDQEVDQDIEEAGVNRMGDDIGVNGIFVAWAVDRMDVYFLVN